MAREGLGKRDEYRERKRERKREREKKRKVLELVEKSGNLISHGKRCTLCMVNFIIRAFRKRICPLYSGANKFRGNGDGERCSWNVLRVRSKW